ncbi:hypothetical protein D3C72_1640240 [compost metagenome]
MGYIMVIPALKPSHPFVVLPKFVCRDGTIFCLYPGELEPVRESPLYIAYDGPPKMVKPLNS